MHLRSLTLVLVALGCTPSGTAVARSPAVLSDVVQIDAANDATCALTSAGEVYCWGFMQGFETPAERPVRIPGPPASRIGMFRDWLWAIDEDGRLLRPSRATGTLRLEPRGSRDAALAWWGKPGCTVSSEGRVSCGGQPPRRLPGGLFLDPAAPFCLATEDAVQCFFQFGVTPLQVLEAPCATQWLDDDGAFRIDLSGRPIRIAHGGLKVCVLTVRGDLECAGPVETATVFGCGGETAGASSERSRLRLSRPGPYLDVGLGQEVSALLRPDGVATDWTDQPIPGATDLVRVAAGHRHACGLHADGTVSCWGSDIARQLGRGVAVEGGRDDGAARVAGPSGPWPVDAPAVARRRAPGSWTDGETSDVALCPPVAWGGSDASPSP